jgi:hypothetical protein
MRRLTGNGRSSRSDRERPGADLTVIAAWTDEGRRRSANARRRPFSGGVHLAGQRDSGFDSR